MNQVSFSTYPAVTENNASIIFQVVAQSPTSCHVGCPGCVSDVFFATPIIPPDKSAFMTSSEAAELVEEVNSALLWTHCPPCPWIFCHFVIPFSPICCFMYFERRRKSELIAILQRWNATTLKDRRCRL